MIGIYKIISPSGRIYIGQSWNIEHRFKSYRKLYKENQVQRFLYNSLLKHGSENHIFEIVHELPIDINQEVLDRYEILYIDLYKSANSTMLNIREGGSRGKFSEESKRKLSNSKMGKFKGRIPWNKGIIYSNEYREKLSNSHKGKRFSEDTKKKLSNSLKGKKRAKYIHEALNRGRRKLIIQMDIKTNDTIQEWVSIQEAADKLKIAQSNISACCRNIKNYKTAGGYKWKYKE